MKKSKMIFYSQEYKQNNMFIKKYKKIVITSIVFIVSLCSVGFTANRSAASISINVISRGSYELEYDKETKCLEVKAVGSHAGFADVYIDSTYMEYFEEADAGEKEGDDEKEKVKKISIIY